MSTDTNSIPMKLKVHLIITIKIINSVIYADNLRSFPFRVLANEEP